MAFGPTKTESVSTKWVMELYAFDSPLPTEDQLSVSLAPTSIIGNSGAKVAIEKKIQALKDKKLLEGGNIESAYGVTSIAYSRSKSTPDGQCQVNFVGRLPNGVHAGAWVVITSVSNANTGQERALVRYVGQIIDVSPDYQVASSGVFIQNSTITIREWSSVLRMPVRYDVFSIEGQQLSNNPAAALEGLVGSALSKLGAKGKSKDEEIKKLLEKAFDPYELAQVILLLVGMISKEDSTSRIKQLNGEAITLPKKAVTACAIPAGVQERLGISSSGAGGLAGAVQSVGSLLSGGGSEGNAINPYMSGFMQTVTGIQKDPVYNSGWDGIFAQTKISDYKGILKKGYESSNNRPATNGIAAITQIGMSAWDLLQNFCDKDINEVYTDMWYEIGENEKDIVGKPVIVIRDKPYLMKSVKDGKEDGIESSNLLDNWTLYDHIPRINIPNSLITRVSLKNTFLNSPNYIRINFSINNKRVGANDSKAALYGLRRLDPEMKRFGGNEFFMETNFIGTKADKTSKAENSTGDFFVTWFETLRELARCWHSYNYRMGSGVIVIKDNNIPLSLGFNVQFEFGNYTLVGQIESISSNYMKESDGTDVNATTIQLSRIVAVDPNNNELTFVDITHWGSLPYETPSFSSNTGIDASLDFGAFV
jgi:hypothetical protein